MIRRKKNKATSHLKILTAGHVDHGKSTLIAHLLYQLESLPEGKYEGIVAVCKRRQVEFEWAFLLDALQAERNQNITIDASYIQLKTKDLQLTFIDAPGHKEFLRNMLTGAVHADGAMIMIDAKDGIQEQTKKHAMILSMLGVRQIVVVINKMDMVAYSRDVYDKIRQEIKTYLAALDIDCDMIVPISAKKGDNLVRHSAEMKWYKGETIYEALCAIRKVSSDHSDQNFRFAIQTILRQGSERILCGKVLSGKAVVGDTVLLSPSNEEAIITSIKAWPVNKEDTVRAGESVALTVDRDLFFDRGFVLSHTESPPLQSNIFKATIFWLGHESLTEGQTLSLQLYGQKRMVTVRRLLSRIDPQTLEAVEGGRLDRYDLGKVLLRSDDFLTFDNYAHNPSFGRFTLADQGHIRGIGILDLDQYPDQRPSYLRKSQNIFMEKSHITLEMREQKTGQRGTVFWMTGLSGAGKSTISHGAEYTLFRENFQIHVLDGDQLRHGINANLGFSPEDRRENVRRTAEVAKMMADLGYIVIVSLISPYAEDREMARRIVGADRFYDVYVKASLNICENRDKKGLYKKAREGLIKSFTGISAPYEAPQQPSLCLETDQTSPESSTQQFIDFIKKKTVI